MKASRTAPLIYANKTL